MNEKFKGIFELRKNSLSDINAKQFAREAYDAMTSIIFGKKDICEIIFQFSSVGFYDHSTCLFRATLNRLVCTGEQYKDLIKINIEKFVTNIFKSLGLGSKKGAIKVLFPPALIYSITSFIWNNFTLLLKLAIITIMPAERELYNTVGAMAGKYIIKMNSLRKTNI